MIALLVDLLILILVCGLVWYIVGLLPLPAPWKQIAMVILALILVLILLGMLLPGAGVHLPLVRG